MLFSKLTHVIFRCLNNAPSLSVKSRWSYDLFPCIGKCSPIRAVLRRRHGRALLRGERR